MLETVLPSILEKGFYMSQVVTQSLGGDKKLLVDNFGRRISYLRLSITDRCNLRCKYCMAEEGVTFLDHQSILSYEELERIVSIVTSLGVEKIRITGGEPFARKSCMEFLTRLKGQQGVKGLFITTNGVAVYPHLAELKKIGISGINLSLDTVDKERFHSITRRDVFDNVLSVFHESLRLSIPLKVNSVIQQDTSDKELVNLSSLINENPISLRFIELMPFSGKRQCEQLKEATLEDRLARLFPGLTEISANSVETARQFRVPGAVGTLGIIEGHSRKFCSTCNKIRITPQGILKTCLYDQGVLDLRELLRNGSSDDEISTAIIGCVSHRHSDGLEVERKYSDQQNESMARIGG